jgi:hypothetical protein
LTLTDSSKISASIRWENWLRDFEIYLSGTGVKNDTQKRAILLHVSGRKIREIFATLEIADEKYCTATKALDNYFKPLKNVEFQQFSFMQIKQQPNETIDYFAVRLQTAAATCDFHKKDDEIKRQIKRLMDVHQSILKRKF